jgi:hypothetical protein
VEGTDIGATAVADYGVHRGVTERVLTDEQAARSYGEPGTADAGYVPDPVGPSVPVATLETDDTDPNLRAVRADETEASAERPNDQPASDPSPSDPSTSREP